jgi:hypothetical protein
VVFAGNVNLLGDNITIKKNTEVLIDAGKEVDLEVSTGKTCMYGCLITRIQARVIMYR